jgi:hypothetical protein
MGQARWVGLSLLCASLLLSAFFALTSAAAAPVASAAGERVEQPSTIAFSSAAYTVNEDAISSTIVLLVEPPSTELVTVTVSSGSIQAEATQDFKALRQSLVISPSEAAYTLTLTILDDDWVEGDEQLQLTLGEYQGVMPGTITETLVTIVDNDVASLSIGDVVVGEEAESVVLLITQSVTSTLESVVDMRTHEGSASEGEDFAAFSAPITIPSGSTAATVTVQLYPDEMVEPNEIFTVTLEDVTNAELAKATATVTIIDDDQFPQIELEMAEANEGEGLLPFVVTLNTTWTQTVTVEYATGDGTARAPADYLTNTGVLTIAPGNITATVVVTLIDDLVDEVEEDLFLHLANPVQAVLSADRVQGIIHDNDGQSFEEFLFLPALAH